MSARPLPFDPIAEAHRQWVAHGWAHAAEGMVAVTSIIRVHQILLHRIESALRPLGLTFARYEVLMILVFSQRGSLPLNKVGARLQVHPTSVTNAVDRLEADGLIARQPHPTDRRTTLAVLLPEGRAVAERATATVNGIFADPLLDTPSMAALIEVLTDLRRRAGDFGSPRS